ANATRGEEVEITTPDSEIKAFGIPTNEELVIARDTKELVENS
ncbi:MAG: acetate kinase, partial [Halanaerobiales bacterium]